MTGQVMEVRTVRPGVTVESIHPDEAPSYIWRTWESILDEAPLLRSPFLAPGWTRLVGQCRNDVFVGVLRHGNTVVALLPYEQPLPGLVRPVGCVFNDQQAVIAAPDVSWSLQDWIVGLGAYSWDMAGQVAFQFQFAPLVTKLNASYAVDLSRSAADYDAWLADWRPSQLREIKRKIKRLEKAIGPIRFIVHVEDHALLDHALALKGGQWEESGWHGRFFTVWEYRMMHGLLTWSERSFAGLFSVLWAGDRPIAFHFGMRGRAVWQGWTIVHDPSYASFSPGILIHYFMFRAGPSLGLDEFDMGMGEFPHKRRLHTHRIPLFHIEMGPTEPA
jgi:CelD/BcsL family acetyltransferase involved in cellulose biosynthesis